MKFFQKFQLILLIAVVVGVVGVVAVVGIRRFNKGTPKYIAPISYGYKNPNALSNAKGEVGNFSLLDHTGVFFELYRNADAKAIVIISQGNDCPIIQKYSREITNLQKYYSSKGVLFYLINSNANDSRAEIITEAQSYNYTPPILMDPSQLVAESLGLTRTSEAIIINPKGWRIIYRGAINDQLSYGTDKQNSRNNYLRAALDSAIHDKPVTVTAVEAKGCLTSFQKPKSLSYVNAIAPLIANKCLNCHSVAGGFLPRFDSYEKIRSWKAMIKETILTDRMPPFSADPHYGKYSNDISMSAEEKRSLVKWIDADVPNDSTLNNDPIKKYKSPEKKLKKKNIIYSVTMAPESIAPGGENEYKYIQLGEAAPYDMWIKGGFTTSTNPRQLHHEAVMIVSRPLNFYVELSKKKFKIDEKKRKENKDGDIQIYVLEIIKKYEGRNSDDYLRFMSWGAGKKQPFSFKDRGVAFLPKGYYLVLETHYMGTGKAETEKTTIDFFGTRTKPVGVKQLHSQVLFNNAFEVPAFAKDFMVETRPWKVEKNIHLNHFLGHLHMRGRSSLIEMIDPFGKTTVIASIPNYYYGWQTGSGLEPVEPIAVKKGSVLRAVCHYDNSPVNPNNPDPSRVVKWGQRVDRTEMCKMNLNYTID